MDNSSENILNSEKFEGMSLEGILNKCHEITNEEIVSVGYGFKKVDGKITNEKCIIFGVSEKLPIDQISEADLIPDKLKILGGSLKTDVVERPKMIPLSACSDFQSWKTSPPSNRNKIRPIKGGLSAINSTDKGGFACTLGFLAKDNLDDSIVAVTNIHCSASEPFIAGSDTYNGIYAANEMIQPSEEYGSMDIQVGFLKRLKYLDLNGYNYSDVSIYSLLNSEFDSSSYQQHGLNIDSPPPFATTQEINDLLKTDPFLFSSGRTTGAKGQGAVKLRVSQINATVTIGGWGSTSQIISFRDCIGFVATPNSQRPFDEECDNPIFRGDSGSALIADINGIKKIIGLVFAGSAELENNEVKRIMEGFACRIDRVACDICISEFSPAAVTPTPTPTETPTPTPTETPLNP
jgi:hypothetical protein